MMTTEAMHTAEFNDAELVAESLGGNRDAFRQIVERYQTLISSLGYCATGNVSQSEDLAQETFVTAWKKLAELREPARLRPWLCSITRFLISKEFRRQGREPVHAAESLEADEWASLEPLPPDQVISEEERRFSGARSNASRKSIVNRWSCFIASTNQSRPWRRIWS
jgi:DNA-directed RNA polymerase specialized sigma24 family protein